MSIKPYVSAPDVFFLQLPSHASYISIHSFETDWGITNERLCFYNGILIGLAHEKTSARYSTVVSLLPKLDHQRKYPWPSSEAFSQALASCLQTSFAWEIRCEQDADQHPVELLTNPSEIRLAIQAALSYSQGECIACPTFIAECGA